MRGIRGVSLGLVVACCAAGIASCGSSSSPSARQLVSDAGSALGHAHGYIITGSLTQNGKLVTVSLKADAAGDSDVALTLNALGFEVIELPGQTFLKGNQTFWSQAAGSQGAPLAGRWIAIPASRATSLTASLRSLEPAHISRCLQEDHGTLSIGGRTTIGGRAAIAVKDAGNVPGSHAGVLDVGASAPHVPLRLTETAGGKGGGTIDVCNDGKATNTTGVLTFSSFGRVPPITAPTNATPLSALG